MTNHFSAALFTTELFVFLHRKGGNQGKNRSPEESHHYDPEWGKVAGAADDHNSLCAATSGPHHQKAAAGFLGDRSQNNS